MNVRLTKENSTGFFFWGLPLNNSSPLKFWLVKIIINTFCVSRWDDKSYTDNMNAALRLLTKSERSVIRTHVRTTKSRSPQGHVYKYNGFFRSVAVVYVTFYANFSGTVFFATKNTLFEVAEIVFNSLAYTFRFFFRPSGMDNTFFLLFTPRN